MSQLIEANKPVLHQVTLRTLPIATEHVCLSCVLNWSYVSCCYCAVVHPQIKLKTSKPKRLTHTQKLRFVCFSTHNEVFSILKVPGVAVLRTTVGFVKVI